MTTAAMVPQFEGGVLIASPSTFFRERVLHSLGEARWPVQEAANLQPAAKEAAASAPDVAGAPPLPQEAGKLEMLMDVELSVSLRFGGRTMLLRDILELCAGTVVELDRQIHEPVELLLDGRTVARGEVVLVEGNYGLRVTELLPLHGG